MPLSAISTERGVINAAISDFYGAWNFLENHPMVQYQGWSMFRRCLDIDVAKVNPVTLKIDDDDSKNTKTEVWLEFGRWERPEELIGSVPEGEFPDGCPQHDIYLDCGAPTFEEAIVELANLVRKKYGARGHRGRGRRDRSHMKESRGAI